MVMPAESTLVAASRRTADIFLAIVGLAIAIPVIAVIGLFLALQDGLPVFFRQVRVGRDGRPFQLLKFRSMRVNACGAQVTSEGDSRITPLGAFLRRYKFDELPQLWNVLRGDMSLIGPRPEVPRYVSAADPRWRRVLAHRPGITDFATLLFRDEERLLAQQADPEQFYREQILPAKLALNVEYLDRRSIWSDFKLIILTFRYSFFPSTLDATSVREAILSR